MTLKDHKNHYNVKFLKGYGLSINVKDSKIVLKNNYDPFKEPEVENGLPLILSQNRFLSVLKLTSLSKVLIFQISDMLY
jgi:hypothetical protein